MKTRIFKDTIEDIRKAGEIIAGGGISRRYEKWMPDLDIRTPIVPTELRNQAGIVGAAYAAANGIRP